MATMDTDSAGVMMSLVLDAFRPRRFLPPVGVVGLGMPSTGVEQMRPRLGDLLLLEVIGGGAVHGRSMSWKGVCVGLMWPSSPLSRQIAFQS